MTKYLTEGPNRRYMNAMLKAITLAALVLLLFAVPSWAENGGCDTVMSIAPDAPEPEHTAPREVALRQTLNANGYEAVHFMRDGDTIVLWGPAPTEPDRLMIQTQVFFAHFYSIEDHIQVPETSAEPLGPTR